MLNSPNVVALLPEYILTLAGIAIMMLEPVLPNGRSRRPLGWLAIFGTAAAGAASFYQLSLGTITAFANSIQVDGFSIFFQVLIAAIVVVTLLSSLDFFEGVHTHAGEYFALTCFAAVGMMLMSCSTELLMIFIGLEISSISTYIMSGYRKGQAAGSESSLKYFLLGSFATAFFLYGIALSFGATGSTNIGAIAAGLPTTNNRNDRDRHWLQGFRCPLPRMDTRCLSGRTPAGSWHDVDGSESRGFCRPATHSVWWLSAV